MPEVPRYYWDSAVFLSYINAAPDRVADIEGYLEQARQGKLELVTSTVSMVEVAFAATEQAGRVLEAEAEEAISALWLPPSPIKKAEFHAQIAEAARGLMREALPRGWSLKPMDAIHLATARIVSVQAFHTYDEALRKYDAIAGFPIGPPLLAQMTLDLEEPKDHDEPTRP